MRWKSACASVTGSSHTSRGEKGQDACSAGTVRLSDNDYFIGIAADGAGSTTDGGRGARIACGMISGGVRETIRDKPDLSVITDEEVQGWIAAARGAIEEEADEYGKKPRDYATTVLCAVAGNGHALFFQIGDGAMVTIAGTECRTVFWPEQGEYANTTYFLTDGQYADHLQIARAAAPDGIALFTDGLQTLALSFAQKSAHPGFFLPLLAALKNSPEDGLGSFSGQLETFLSREDISARSDDDRTLVLAARMTG
jgi:hypothetical protein